MNQSFDIPCPLAELDERLAQPSKLRDAALAAGMICASRAFLRLVSVKPIQVSHRSGLAYLRYEFSNLGLSEAKIIALVSVSDVLYPMASRAALSLFLYH